MSKSDWQPIETAPKDGTEILVWRKPIRVVAQWVKKDQSFGVEDSWTFLTEAEGYDSDYRPTHWMPLPLPPEEPQ